MRRLRGAQWFASSAAAAMGALIWSESPVAARDPSAVTRIEEDWQLELNEPDIGLNAPQFHTVMSPHVSLQGVYFQVTWNYRELPDFVDGGLQLQVWNGEVDFASRDVGADPLSRDAETVTWTSSLTTDASHVSFSILNGHSLSWGSFGGETMTVRTRRPITSFSGYDPATSVANSWISYGSNRVSKLSLRGVRYYDAEGNLVAQDDAERVIFEASDNDSESN